MKVRRPYGTKPKKCVQSVEISNRGCIWILPEEVLIYVFRGLHIRDLLSLRSTCSYFQQLIDDNCSLWTSAGFSDTWPMDSTFDHFEHAANEGNIEAMVKLAIAYLYNEGMTGDSSGEHTEANGYLAAEWFMQVEMLTQNMMPFTWLFIRPPWGPPGVKEYVLRNMTVYCELDADPAICLCIAKTLLHIEDDDTLIRARRFLQMAAQAGSSEAAMMLWKEKDNKMAGDRSRELNNIRELRVIARRGLEQAQLELCILYARGRYGGIPTCNAASYVRDFIQSSKPTNILANSSASMPTNYMRYILVDWMVEVACEKEFSNQTLHAAVSVVDRYLRSRSTSFTRVQLLGVAAMVICSRLFEPNIMAIREAAWLTENTYVYDDVVKMMAEITAVLKGNFRTLVTLDYLNLISQAASDDDITRHMAKYVCELSLLQSSFCEIPQGKIAASCVLMARVITKQQSVWPRHLEDWTGFNMSDIMPTVLQLHKKCLDAPVVVDHRDVTLKTVKEKYTADEYSNVSKLQVPTWSKMCQTLGVKATLDDVSEQQVNFDGEVITSPKRATKSGSSQGHFSSEMSGEIDMHF